MSPSNLTSISDPTNPNSSNTLSGRSAAFIIIALILGTLSQPPGSLIISYRTPDIAHWRIWRLSPLLCGLEGLIILFALFHAPFVHASQRQRAFTIMARRTSTTHHETRSLIEHLERPKLELILPMVLQIWKVIFIRGSRITSVMATFYWLNWAVVQYCHCWVWFAPITREGAACYHPQNTVGSICQPRWGGEEATAESVLIFDSNYIGTIIQTGEVYLTIFFTISFLDPFEFLAIWPSFLSICRYIFSWLFMFAYAIIVGAILNLGKCFKPARAPHDFDIGLSRAGSSFIVFGTILAYYMFYYQEAGTYKPSWVD